MKRYRTIRQILLNSQLAILLIGCSANTQNEEFARVYSYEPTVLESGNIIGRLSVHEGCLVILPSQKDFERAEILPVSETIRMDMPLFVSKPTIGRDVQGPYLVVKEGDSKLRIGDRVEGTGGPIWIKGGAVSSEEILSDASPRASTPCGTRIVQIRRLKRFGDPDR